MILNKSFTISLLTLSLLLVSTKDVFAGEEVLTVEKNKVLSCEEYYNKSASSPYIGEVVKKGHYLVERDPKTYVLTKTFVVDSITVNCKLNPEVEKEFRVVNCDTGFSGEQKQYRNFIKDESLETNEVSVSYPNGENWVTIEDTCSIESEIVENKNDKTLAPNVLSGLLSVDAVKTSELKNTLGYENFIISLNNSTINNHRLNIDIDNLSDGEYNRKNVTNAIKAYMIKTNDVTNFNIVSIPQTLIGYLGYDGLKRDNIRHKVFKSAYITDDGLVVVSYQILSANTEPETKFFSVDLFSEYLGVGQTNTNSGSGSKSKGKYIYR